MPDSPQPDPDFHALATELLPRRLAELESARRWPVAHIISLTPRAFAKETGLDSEVRGLYVFFEVTKPFYVGISRDVRLRIRQHVGGKGHNDASLAFLLARKTTGAKGRRSFLMTQEHFKAAFDEARARLHKMDVAILHVPHEVERYVLEVYAALKLGTRDLNSFETH